jgi:hypothetical protein
MGSITDLLPPNTSEASVYQSLWPVAQGFNARSTQKHGPKPPRPFTEQHELHIPHRLANFFPNTQQHSTALHNTRLVCHTSLSPTYFGTNGQIDHRSDQCNRRRAFTYSAYRQPSLGMSMSGWSFEVLRSNRWYKIFTQSHALDMSLVAQQGTNNYHIFQVSGRRNMSRTVGYTRVHPCHD